VDEDGYPVDVEMQKNGSKYVFIPTGTTEEGEGTI